MRCRRLNISCPTFAVMLLLIGGCAAQPRPRVALIEPLVRPAMGGPVAQVTPPASMRLMFFDPVVAPAEIFIDPPTAYAGVDPQ